jgi:complement component 1 Q subcomponent-binding protein
VFPFSAASALLANPHGTSKGVATDYVSGALPDTRSNNLSEKQRISAAEEGRAKRFPVPLTVVIEKDGLDATLAFEVVADDGDIQIFGILHHPSKGGASAADADAGESKSAHYGSVTYTGPVYGTLDEDLQRLMEDNLRDRGIDGTLAEWVPQYADFKEQREYVKWLGGKRMSLAFGHVMANDIVDVKAFIEK